LFFYIVAIKEKKMTNPNDMITQNQLDDIKTQFYATMENYPTMFANFKASPNLPSARDAHDKTDAALTSLHRRMFAFQAALEKALNTNETAAGQLTAEGAKLNAMVARRTAVLNNKTEMMTPQSVSGGKSIVLESFVSGLASQQLPGCSVDPSGNPTNCPCVDAGGNACSAKCGTRCPASAIQLSLVAEARDIEKREYIYAIFRIVYLVVGIAMVSYFVYHTVGGPDSTILKDAKIKAELLKQNAEQLRTRITDKMSGDGQVGQQALIRQQMQQQELMRQQQQNIRTT
jgi:hypothetical protein